MTQPTAPVAVTKTDDGFLFKLFGTVSFDLAPIEQEVGRVVAAKPRRVSVDLAGCDMISSAGMGCLLSLYHRVHANGGNVQIIAIPRMIFMSFKVGRLDRVFGIGPEAILG